MSYSRIGKASLLAISLTGLLGCGGRIVEARIKTLTPTETGYIAVFQDGTCGTREDPTHAEYERLKAIDPHVPFRVKLHDRGDKCLEMGSPFPQYAKMDF